MAIKQTQKKSLATNRGFTLLIAVIFMSVMLAFGLALSSLSYKQQVLASSAILSQYAFYAADAGLECGLYADQQQNLFAYPASSPSSAPTATCDNAQPISSSDTWSPTRFVVTNRFSLDSNTRCVDVTVYKPNGTGTTYIFSQGYDLPCTTVANPPTGARIVSRGINIRY
jgi:Tfp pilus assembly protein PilX